MDDQINIQVIDTTKISKVDQEEKKLSKKKNKAKRNSQNGISNDDPDYIGPLCSIANISRSSLLSGKLEKQSDLLQGTVIEIYKFWKTLNIKVKQLINWLSMLSPSPIPMSETAFYTKVLNLKSKRYALVQRRRSKDIAEFDITPLSFSRVTGKRTPKFHAEKETDETEEPCLTIATTDTGKTVKLKRVATAPEIKNKKPKVIDNDSNGTSNDDPDYIGPLCSQAKITKSGLLSTSGQLEKQSVLSQGVIIEVYKFWRTQNAKVKQLLNWLTMLYPTPIPISENALYVKINILKNKRNALVQKELNEDIADFDAKLLTFGK